MLFSSITFLIVFLPLTIIVYYLVPRKLKNFVMLLSSLIFYAWGEPIYVVLMILSILLNYFCGLDIGQKIENPLRAKRGLIFGVTVNILILGFFKYYGFLIETLNAVLPFDLSYRELALPIGISFYTFQAMSYLVDVYRGDVREQKNVLNFALYICMFPQLIAGPIVRYVDIEKQLKQRTLSAAKFGRGSMYFICGLAKKVILANTAGALYEEVAAMQMGSFSMLTAWVGCIAFAFQIYFDFSGYSDMAIGLGKMFGFELRQNFRYPYVSKSITEFWRRWHISLGTWFREYVYIPLGGNRCASSRNILNLLIVWLLTGLWHGAAWNFVVWGLYYGIILVLEKHVWGNLLERMPNVVRHLYSLVLILIGWVFFFSPNMGYAMDYIGVMFGPGANGFIDKQALFLIVTNWLLLLICAFGSTTYGQKAVHTITGAYKSRKARRIASCVFYVAVLLISLAFLVTDTYNPFLYFRF